MIEQGGGQIISVSTVSAKAPAAPRWASYQGSKAGFDVWLRALAAEVGGQGVRVSSVYMPLVRTRMSAAGGLYRQAPALTPREADGARAVLDRGQAFPVTRRAYERYVLGMNALLGLWRVLGMRFRLGGAEFRCQVN